MKCLGLGLIHLVRPSRQQVTWCDEALVSEDIWPVVDENEVVTCLECIGQAANAAQWSRAYAQRLMRPSVLTKPTRPTNASGT